MAGTGSSVIRPIFIPSNSVNHRLPSGPAAMPKGRLFTVGTSNSVITPGGLIRPILLLENSMNHRFPSGPAAMPRGAASGVGMSLGDDAGGADPPDLVAVAHRKPHVPVGAGGDALRGTSWDPELGQAAGGGDPPDADGVGLG